MATATACCLTALLPRSPCSHLLLQRAAGSLRTPAMFRPPPIRCISTESSNPSAAAPASTHTSSNDVPVDQRSRATAMERRTRRPDISPFGLVDSLSPMRTMRQMFNAFDRFFEDAMYFPGSDQEIRSPWEMREENGEVKMRFDMPGLSKDEVRVRVEDDALVVKGEQKREEGDGEWWKGETERSVDLRIMLPRGCDKEKVKAELKHGVLLVTVPRSQADQKVVDVEIQ